MRNLHIRDIVTSMELQTLTAVSSVDGRYREVSAALAPFLSEYALIRFRIRVECEYLVSLSGMQELGMRALSAAEKKLLAAIADEFSLDDAMLVKKFEREGHEDIPATSHDAKAVEYFLKKRLESTSLADVREWLHFGLTSEDVNSVAYGLMLREALREVIVPALRAIEENLEKLARAHADTSMLARTHGQPASPTTFGKEMKVFAARIRRHIDQLENREILVKFGGATGNWNAHIAAAPEVDWIAFSERFVGRFNEKGAGITLVLNPFTTQIEPHDTYAELFDTLRRTNTILIDFSQDMWRYISDGWVAQKPKEGEVGSSTMPHKVNPIDFENSEGNLGIANALFNHFSNKLPISRLQRDLSDSTVKRAFGTAFAHALIGYRSLLRGLEKVAVNEAALHAALDAHPEVLAEAIQTVLRREGVAVPYEQLKKLTRGRKVSLDEFAAFVDSLELNGPVKKHLKTLRPENYIGLAASVARQGVPKRD